MAASVLAGLVDRVVLVGATVAGGCVPGFLAQHRQRAGGRLDQVIEDLAPFREIADRFHGGSLEALVQHHLASSDPAFHAEGAAIQAMIDAEARLSALIEALQGGVWRQLAYVVRFPDAELLRATWGSWVPSFTLDPQGLLVAAVVGLLAWLLVLALMRGLGAVARRLTGTQPGAVARR